MLLIRNILEVPLNVIDLPYHSRGELDSIRTHNILRGLDSIFGGICDMSGAMSAMPSWCEDMFGAMGRI